MKKVILSFLEHQNGKVTTQSWEALGASQHLAALSGMTVEGLILTGENITPPLHGINIARRIASSDLAQYTPDGYTSAIAGLLSNLEDVAYIVFPHSYQVRDFAPKLAFQLDCPLLTDCIGMRDDNGEILFSRQLYQGKFIVDTVFNGKSPFLVSIQAGNFKASEDRPDANDTIIKETRWVQQPSEIRTRTLKRMQESSRSIDLSQSDIIVAVGRGIGEVNNIPIAENLAKALGAQLAGSRPVCDNGWLPMERQVGSSGQTVFPALYVALGISGAIQHLVGMKGSRKIVAINKDPKAPIFEIADIGIVSNLFDIVPLITEEIQRSKQEQQ